MGWHGRGAIARWVFCFLLLAGVACSPEPPAGEGEASSTDTSAGADLPTGGDDAGDSAADTGTLPAVDVQGDTGPQVCQAASDCGDPGPCRTAACTPQGTCAAVAKPAGSPCDDGNACTTTDSCEASQCKGGPPLDCSDGSPCTVDLCHAGSGCAHLPAAVTTACDDGNPCTVGDFCAAGACSPGLSVCQCQTHTDCGKFEDGDFCNGTLYCDTTAGPPFMCKPNPASQVQCPTDADGPCQKNVCIPSTGACELALAPTNTACDDGNSCTVGDFCGKGLCLGGTDTCTCKTDADCQDEEDGNACNGTLFCNKVSSQCQLNPATVVHCPTVDDTTCRQNLCNPKDGKCHYVPVSEGKGCDDGNPCTPNETCQAGQCAAAVNTCKCQSDTDCAAAEDGNLCNGKLFCDLATYHCKVNPATVVKCNTDDDPPCSRDVCNPKIGKCEVVTLPKDGTPCDDGNPCTPSATCQAGQCVGGVNTCPCSKNGDCAAKEDDDLCNGTLFCHLGSNTCEVNPATVVTCPGTFDETCLTNQCDPKSGSCGMKPAHQGHQCGDGSVCAAGGWCQLGKCAVETLDVCACVQNADCAKAEDGDLCNGTLYCDKTGGQPVCKVNPATVVTCQTTGDTACSQQKCVPASGKCQPTPQSGACDDGLQCTQLDGCQGGVCVGLPEPCGDGNPCTSDACQEPFGCVNLPAGPTACDDGNGCTASDACADGTCLGKKLACDDANPCTTDACDPAKGCVATPNAGPCSDGDACTAGDACSGGQCKPGPQVDCDDADACTADTCDKASGACGHVDTTAKCSDGNPCTLDSCSKDQGCGHVPVSAPCSDGNACTFGDACKSGVCLPAGLTACNDDNLCTDDSCDPKVGCVFAPNAKPCSDGDACALQQACKGGLCVTTKAVNCDDGNVCTDDGCDPVKGCAQVANTKACDASSCTAGSVCKGGTCLAGSKILLSAVKLQETNTWDVKAVTAYPGGDIGLVGAKMTGYNTVPIGGFAARVGADGKAAWFNLLADGTQALSGAHALGDGTLVTVGQASSQDGKSVRFDGSGKSVATTTYPGWGTFDVLVPHPAGGWWACSNAPGGKAYVLRLGQDSSILVSSSDLKVGVGAVCRGLAVAPNGDVLAVGNIVLDGIYKGWYALLNASATPVATGYVFAPSGGELAQASARKGGGFVLAGKLDYNYGGRFGALVALDAAGKKVWEREYGASNFQTFTAVEALPDGGILAGGYTHGGGTSSNDAWVVRADTWGNVVWERIFAVPQEEVVRDLALRPDVGFAIGVVADASSYLVSGRPQVVRADAWGNTACEASGVCLDLGFGDCDDGNPCTADTCHPVTGCKHAAHPEGARCSATQTCGPTGTCTVPLGMKEIPAGDFWMGCVAGDPLCAQDEGPAHVVQLGTYQIDLTEVTVLAYSACVSAGACTAPVASSKDSTCNFGATTRSEHPVNCVTWDQAAAYCKWAGKRLPTEAEWEKAARGGCNAFADTATCKAAQTLYTWGKAAPSCTLAHLYDKGNGCGTQATAVVGSKPEGKSPYGLFDVAGNVREWVADWYDKGYYATSPGSDPAGPSSGTQRLTRGGGLSGVGSEMRVSLRQPATSPYLSATGFRCARTP